MRYRRIYVKGASYFFTLVTYQRQKILTEQTNINHLRNAFKKVKAKYPFEVTAIVILPDHLHAILELPDNDSDFSTRWRLIKYYFSRKINSAAFLNATSRNKKKEKPIWQRRYWDHLIRNEKDFERHMDYIHYNPVKHGYTTSPALWPYTSFHMYVNEGIYPAYWGETEPAGMCEMDFE